jgi:hypothetical protein
MLGEPALSSVAGLGLEPVDEIDDVVEAAAGTIADTASGDSDGQMGLAGTGAADQNDIALLGDEAAAGEIIGKRFADPLVRSMTGACKAGLGSTRWRYDCRRQNGRPIGRLEGEPRQSA